VIIPSALSKVGAAQWVAGNLVLAAQSSGSHLFSCSSFCLSFCSFFRSF
jgi:di/tricarboxylate transporter